MDEKNRNENNKNGKILSIIIAILAIVVVGLGGVLIYQLTSKQNGENVPTAAVSEQKENTEKVTEQVQNDLTDDISEKDTGVSETQKDKEETTQQTKKDDTSKKNSSVVISDGGSWQNGDKYVHQYNVRISNSDQSEFDGWEVWLTSFEGAKILDFWNAEIVIDNGVLKAKAKDYNSVIQKGENTEFGFQAEFSDESAASKEVSCDKLFVAGKEYLSLNEQSKDKNSDNKNEKENEKKSDTTEKVKKPESEDKTPVENHGALSVNGTDIVDKDGKKYQLKGASTHGLQWFPDYVNKDTFRTFRDDWGANLIRLALYTDENGYCSGGNKDKLKSLVEDGVQYATELGMYVIIDWHILHDLTPKKYQSEAESFFDEMSKKYADYENVLYEICNEPNSGVGWSEVKEYAEDIIPIIRKNDPNAIIIVGTPNWSQDVDLAAEDPIKGQKNIMYSLHFYAATHKDDLRGKFKKAHDKGLPVFISEFSICDASGNGGIDYDSANAWKEVIREYNLSYAEWSICNKDEAASLIAPGNNKLSDWSEDEISETGKWLKELLSEN